MVSVPSPDGGSEYVTMFHPLLSAAAQLVPSLSTRVTMGIALLDRTGAPR